MMRANDRSRHRFLVLERSPVGKILSIQADARFEGHY